MAAGPIGPHWASDTWPDTAWEAGSWGGAVVFAGTSLRVLGLSLAGLALSTPTDAGSVFAVSSESLRANGIALSAGLAPVAAERLRVSGLAVSAPPAAVVGAGLRVSGVSGSGLTGTMAAQADRAPSVVTAPALDVTSTGLSVSDIGSV